MLDTVLCIDASLKLVFFSLIFGILRSSYEDMIIVILVDLSGVCGGGVGWGWGGVGYGGYIQNEGILDNSGSSSNGRYNDDSKYSF